MNRTLKRPAFLLNTNLLKHKRLQCHFDKLNTSLLNKIINLLHMLSFCLMLWCLMNYFHWWRKKNEPIVIFCLKHKGIVYPKI